MTLGTLDTHFIKFIKKDAKTPEEIVIRLVEGMALGNTKYIESIMKKCGTDNMMKFANKILGEEFDPQT